MIFNEGYEIVTDEIYLRLSDILPSSDVLLKLEGLNPAGSIKLKTAVAMVTDAEELGVLKPGGHVIESSSGSLGVALGMVTAARGYGFTCVTDPNTSRHSIDVMNALGVRVVEVGDQDANGGFLGSRIAYIRSRLDDEPELIWLNQYANPANVRAHAERTAAAILREHRQVDFLFVGAGTGGTLIGCVKHFREHSPSTRIVAVDSVGSVTFGRPPAPRHIPGLGASRKPEICSEEMETVIWVPEIDAIRMCRSLAGRHGVFLGGSTGSVLSAVSRMADEIPPGSVVVAISPDLGDRYAAGLYTDDWVIAKFGPGCLGPDPSSLPTELGVP